MEDEEEMKEVLEVAEQKAEKADNTLLMVLLTVVLLALGFYAYKKLIATKPEAKKAEVESWTPSVRVVDIEVSSYTPEISTEGIVATSTRTMLISEVAGGIVYISPLLEAGNVIHEGEILIKLDDADYEAQLTSAKSSLADGELLLAQEKARAIQAEREWKKLGRGGVASDLVMRIPQIKSAEAKIEAAEAMIKKAKRDVKKTVIIAPYTCMVNQKFIDSGAFVSSMSQIAEVSSIDKYKVRLPIDLNELTFLGENSGIGAEVVLESRMGGKDHSWNGVAVRFEGGVDSNTFSRMMVVDVRRDESQDKGFELPPLGLFLQAKLKGDPLGEVFSIPREALREGDRVWRLGNEGTLSIIDVNVIRTERDSVLLDTSSLKNGDRIVVSPIAIPVEGMKLKLELDPEQESKMEDDVVEKAPKLEEV